MKRNTLYILITFIILVLIMVGLFFLEKGSIAASTKYDEFSTCLADKGAKFYGAFWCPHCRNQKKMFENSTKIPYTECSTPDGSGQNQTCNDAGINSYPTWTFADGDKRTGELSLQTLSEKTGCVLPVAVAE